MGFLLAVLCVTTISLGDLPVNYRCMERSSGWLQAMCLCIWVFGRWTCVCTCADMCIHGHMCVHTDRCTCSSRHVCVHRQVCVYLGRHVYAQAGMCIHGHACLCMGTCVNTQAGLCVHGKMCMWVGMCVYTGKYYMYMGRRAHARTDIFLGGQTCVFMGICVLCMGGYMCTEACVFVGRHVCVQLTWCLSPSSTLRRGAHSKDTSSPGALSIQLHVCRGCP